MRSVKSYISAFTWKRDENKKDKLKKTNEQKKKTTTTKKKHFILLNAFQKKRECVIVHEAH